MNVPGALAALNQIVALVDDGPMPKGTSYSVMGVEMKGGEPAMMVSGPWAWGNLRKSGIPFVGALGAMIDRSPPNADLAVEFLKNHLLTDAGLRTMNADVPLGVPALESFYNELSKDPLIAASVDG